MDSGANDFIFHPDWAVQNTLQPSRKLLVSAAGAGHDLYLDSGIVRFGLCNQSGSICYFQFRAYFHASLPLCLLSLSRFQALGLYFDFYTNLAFAIAANFFPFHQDDGLYLADLYGGYSSDSVLYDFSSAHLPVDAARAFAVTRLQSKSGPVPHRARALSRSASVDRGQSLDSAPAADAFVPSTSALSGDFPVLPDPSSSDLHHQLTGVSRKLLDYHHRWGHPSDAVLRHMVELMDPTCRWPPKLVLRQHCWSCQRGQQHRQHGLPNDDLLKLHPDPCAIIVYDFCGPHPIPGLHGERYTLLCACPNSSYFFGKATTVKSDMLPHMEDLFCHVRGKTGEQRIAVLKFDGAPNFITEAVHLFYRTKEVDHLKNAPTHHYQLKVLRRESMKMPVWHHIGASLTRVKPPTLSKWQRPLR